MILELCRKTLLRLPPETAHHLAIFSLSRFSYKNSIAIPDGVSQTIWNKNFVHPLGIGAGFDKDAEAYNALGKLGFSFVEVGSITPKAQPGNPRPRLFRLKDMGAIINRYGFNSKGMLYAQQRLIEDKKNVILGVNLGKNKDSVDYLDDFMCVAEGLIDYADYLTINLSSPNTPGLRDLQHAETIEPLLEKLHRLRLEKKVDCPILIKLSPDMESHDEANLLTYLAGSLVDGLIVSNTTVSRHNFSPVPTMLQTGGMSGKPLQERARDMLTRVFKVIGYSKPIIASGGIDSGAEAYRRICLGASLCQIYTAFIYEGPAILPKMLAEIECLMRQDGFETISQAIGSYYEKHSG
ncbi:quinone-dependent dihydroorotate dehydrogenase [Pectobacterium sp. PL64]|uniref:quinone-dependent dihydroorotate dehydrogenase n=1 Tax=Pectobacterium sp. PL64 TaxID=2738983 RepID=UPI001F0C2CB1|nr:quinone-dependent dihydroorotate dehydrogenase [Pectobacterium sp. PL64]UMO87902.1 quinone-dependent dihydroorotate dehydrogenase [Pectobacterium sp. PL64]